MIGLRQILANVRTLCIVNCLYTFSKTKSIFSLLHNLMANQSSHKVTTSHLCSWEPLVFPSINLSLCFSLQLCFSSLVSLYSSYRSKEVPLCSSNSFRYEQCNWRRYKRKSAMRSTLKRITVMHNAFHSWSSVYFSMIYYLLLKWHSQLVVLNDLHLLLCLSRMCLIHPTTVDFMISAAFIYQNHVTIPTTLSI